MISSKHVTEGLMLFAEREILPALEGWRLWTGSAAIALFYRRSESLIPKLANNKYISALGIMDKDGGIDVEAASGALKEAARKHGKLTLDIPVLDIVFNFSEKDIETLCGYIKTAAGAE